MLPENLIEDAVFNAASPGGNTQEYQQDRILFQVGVLVARDFGCRIGIDAELFLQLALERGYGRFITFHFAAWELPLQGMRLFGTAALQIRMEPSRRRTPATTTVMATVYTLCALL